MIIKAFTFNPFQTNCYVCHEGREAVIIDPGCYEPHELKTLLGYVKQEGLDVKHLLLTHGHIDHVFACSDVAAHFGKGFWMHRDDEPLLARAPQDAASFGVQMAAPPPPAGYLAEGDEVQFGNAVWQVLLTPGHSPGSICFFDEAGRYVIAGDVLFQGSIGRTDLWRGSMPMLMRSIFDKLLPLGDDVVVYPGHGPATTIGAERSHNPFLTADM